MKKLTFLLLFVFLAFVACKKKTNKSAIVVRDCTGTYIRYEEKDYQVSNIDKVAPFSDGATVKVTFKLLENYDDSSIDEPWCKMLHIKEGWIEVKKIE